MRYMINHRIAILVILVLYISLSACGNGTLPHGHRGEPFKLADLNLQKEVLYLMNKDEIPYKVDERGFVHYLLEHQSEVHGIIRSAKYGESLSREIIESKTIIDTSIIDNYTKAFDESGVPYSIRRERTHYTIEWVQLHGPKVDVIIEEIDKQLLDQLVEN